MSEKRDFIFVSGEEHRLGLSGAIEEALPFLNSDDSERAAYGALGYILWALELNNGALSNVGPAFLRQCMQAYPQHGAHSDD